MTDNQQQGKPQEQRGELQNVTDPIEQILELFKRFMPENIAIDDRKQLAMYEAYHKVKALSSPPSSIPTEEQKANNALVEALEGIFKKPHGCPMCDSGRLRNEVKEHWDDCPFKIAIETLSKYRQK